MPVAFLRLAMLSAACVLLAVFATTQAQNDPANPPLSDLLQKFLDLRWEILKEVAREQVLQAEERNRKDLPNLGNKAAPVIDPADLINKDLKTTHASRKKALRDEEEVLGKNVKNAKSAWYAQNAELIALKVRQRNVEDEIQATTPRPAWDSVSTGIALCGLCAVTVGILLSLHERRRHWRNYFRFGGKMAGAAALVFTFTTPIFLARAQEPDQINQEILTLRAVLTKTKSQNEAKEKEIDEAHADRVGKLNKWFPAGFSEEFVAAEKQAHRQFRDIQHMSRLLQVVDEDNGKIAKKANEVADKVKDKEAELTEKKREQLASSRLNIGIKIGMALLFAIAAFVPLRRAIKKSAAELRDQADQCPCCLAKDSLEEKTSQVTRKQMPDPIYMRCAECGYELPPGYHKLPRFCFPTVGIPGSGKTFWLVKAYEMIKDTKVPVAARFQKAPSMMDDEFDNHIVRILENHQEPRGTLHDQAGVIPYPLVFHLGDCDQLGNNEAMLNLFDFSGEMMKRHINTDVLRQRALLMEGFVLFLDPTKVLTAKGGVSIKNQIDAVAKLYQEVRVMRKIDVGSPVPVPVAVCISKLDLIVTQNPLSRAALPWLRALRESFNKPVTLEEIQRRSKLCEPVLANLFPSWNLKRNLRENFGKRFLFFPLTPVGLEEGELGQTDLRRRNFAPVGVLEPIIWLMHMHGFNVFS